MSFIYIFGRSIKSRWITERIFTNLDRALAQLIDEIPVDYSKDSASKIVILREGEFLQENLCSFCKYYSYDLNKYSFTLSLIDSTEHHILHIDINEDTYPQAYENYRRLNKLLSMEKKDLFKLYEELDLPKLKLFTLRITLIKRIYFARKHTSNVVKKKTKRRHSSHEDDLKPLL